MSETGLRDGVIGGVTGMRAWSRMLAENPKFAVVKNA
jgi:hypothetical protein